MGSTEKLNPDLKRERARCTFDTHELTLINDGDINKHNERKEREQILLEDPELQSPIPIEFLSHKEKYEEAMRKACLISKKLMKLQNEGKADIDSYKDFLGFYFGSGIFPEGNPLQLHYAMFVPTLIGQATLEQQMIWLQRAWDLDIIGTYAQTELGHGTFIRGLETTATYDAKTEEFVLHSPKLTSYKWWPGGLGQSTNYAIVMAQLYTKGQCYGIHAFIVQLRDEDSHLPMPGIKIGEIGTKLGMNTTNNGFLGLEHVRIPRLHMLMKNSQVLEDGTYVKATNSKLTYGTMIFVRVMLVVDCTHILKNALTIAVRYSAVRRQSQLKDDEPEIQIIDFVTQQNKLFPYIGMFYAFKFAGAKLWDLYNNIRAELENGDLDRLPELHSLACCLKAICTADTTQAVETLRMACGGHGYMISSNLPRLYGLVTAMCTYEGENTVLHLQAARFLVKQYKSMLDGEKVVATVSYLELLKQRRPVPFNKSIEWIIQAMRLVAARKIEMAYNGIQERLKQGLSYEDAWNDSSILLTKTSEIHCRTVILEIYYEEMNKLIKTSSKSLSPVLRQLMELYIVYTATLNLGDIIMFTEINAQHVQTIQMWYVDLMLAIRPNAVGLVDSFDVPDGLLNSTLGVYNGNVYEELYKGAQRSPSNIEPVNKSFHLYLKPLLRANL